MDNKSKYKLSFLKGTSSYVIKELLDKFPAVNVLETNKTDLTFENDSKDIEEYRTLYSPTRIEDRRGRVLNLSKRKWRKGFVSAGINPSLAYIMCMIAQLKESNIIYDPFCGSSVIPITAVKYFAVKRVMCSDISGKAIDISKENFKSADISKDRYKIFRSDISDVALNKKNLDRIISNLPFGIRVGDHENNVKIYSALEKLADKLLRSKGKLVLLTQEKKLLRETFKKHWNVKSLLKVNQGGLLPEVFEISRK